ncbi:hypothetical protein C8R44DRAFT_869943 [Mycena epipterygia]|nr:hypothetical protein C8R44DRAFT_869943 [Mycena epipterygia]
MSNSKKDRRRAKRVNNVPDVPVPASRRTPSHVPLPASSTSTSSTTSKTLVSFKDRPLVAPFIAYVEDEDDAYDLRYLSPEIADELGHGARSSTSSSEHPRYYLVHTIKEEVASAWLISSLCSDSEEQNIFLTKMRKKDANLADYILPIDPDTKAMALTYPYFPTRQLRYCNPENIATQKNPLEGFLVVPAEAHFPLAEFKYYTPHSFECEANSLGREVKAGETAETAEVEAEEAEAAEIAQVAGRNAQAFREVANEMLEEQVLRDYADSQQRVARYREATAAFEGQWEHIREGVDDWNSEEDPTLETPVNSPPQQHTTAPATKRTHSIPDPNTLTEFGLGCPLRSCIQEF